MRRKLGIGCLGVVGLLLVVGFFGALIGGPDDTTVPEGERAAVVPTFTDTPTTIETSTPTPDQGQEPDQQMQPTVQEVEVSQETISTPTSSPSATHTPENTATPIFETEGPIVSGEANLREGPGTDYGVTGFMASGSQVELIGQDSTGEWYQLADGNWIAAFLVERALNDLPVTVVQAQLPGGQPEQEPTIDTGWSKTVRGYEFRSDCPCSDDTLNCPSFASGFAAQACFEKCMEERGIDVHKLDADKDGSACEWEW